MDLDVLEEDGAEITDEELALQFDDISEMIGPLPEPESSPQRINNILNSLKPDELISEAGNHIVDGALPTAETLVENIVNLFKPKDDKKKTDPPN